MNLSAILRSGFKQVVMVVIFLATIEVCSRIDDAVRFGSPFFEEYNADILSKYDRDGPYNVPGARFEKWRNNSNGFRGPEIASLNQPGALRVFCLGASETYGLYESEGNEWPALLRKMLPESRYQIINASVAGLTLRSFEPYMVKHVMALKPGIVILIINPYFYAEAAERGQRRSPPDPAAAAKAIAQTSPPFSAIILKNIRCLPKIKRTLKDWIKNSFPEWLHRYQTWNLKKQLRLSEIDNLNGAKARDSVSKSTLSSFENDLTRLIDFLQSREVRVVLCTYPALINRSNLGLYPVVFLDARRGAVNYSLEGMIDIVDKTNSIVRKIAGERRIMLLDCHTLVPQTDEYFADNVHYTDRGAKVIASGVVDLLLKNRTLSGSPPAADCKAQQ